ncbi:MAG: AraC family transcriptional regulator [Caulobacterales bacterium]|nr:AraC family transcriptional regulator [Caulobacterales bacterium]
MSDERWIQLRRDPETGIESLRAYFRGHAYDPHTHDEVLVGFTEAGVQQFRCRRRLVTSTPGRAILMEPGEPHDGRSPPDEGFTYGMLYLPAAWLRAQAERHGARGDLGFRHTLAEDAGLLAAIRGAFSAVHAGEGRLTRDQALDGLVAALAGVARPPAPATREPGVAQAHAALHEGYQDDIGLDDLAAASGLDRFRLTRAFKAQLGLSPHAYLVQLRLRAARRQLARGTPPAQAAADAGFADQSHLGRWFRRAYGLTPAAYRRACTNVPD